MLPVHIFPEAGGLIALGPTHIGHQLVLQICRDHQRSSATLNRHELTALIAALQTELRTIEAARKTPNARSRTDAKIAPH